MERHANHNLGRVRWLIALALLAACGVWVPKAQADGSPVPYVEDLSPVTVAPGSGDFTLTVNGDNFVAGSVVQWNGSALTTTFVGSKQLTATVPGSDVAAEGTATVEVVNPGSLASNTIYFTVTSPTASLFFRLTNQSPSAGVHPNAPVLGDFNNDGYLDIAVSNTQTGPGNVSIFLGNGNGSFQAATNYLTGTFPQGMAIGDFNGDGYEDLAVANYTDSTLTILLNNGDGTFTSRPPTPLPAGSQPVFVATGDFNQDGTLDLAVACHSPSADAIAILLGNGDGTFQSAVTYGFAIQANGLALGDFNNDGFLDLAVTDANNPTVWVFKGVGDGTFGPGTPFTTDLGPAGVVAGDFNGDGNLDLAVTDVAAGNVAVLLNNGSGFQSYVPYALASGGSFLVEGDFNGDGITDLTVASASQNTFSVLLGNGTGGVGNGTFGNYVSYVTDPNSTAQVGLADGDLDGDGRFDFVFIVTPQSQIDVLLQSGELSTSPASLDFGDQAVGTQSGPMTLSLSNAGSADLIIYNVSSTDPTDFPETSNCGPFPRTFHPGDGCTVSVMFAPSMEGALSGDIRIGNSGSNVPAEVPLTGTGVAPEASLAPSSLSFGNQLVGTTSASQPLTLSNTGNADLIITSVAATSGYLVDNQCGGTLAAGSSCMINVSFSPTLSGADNGTLTVTDNSNGVTGSTQTSALTGTGVAPVAHLTPSTLTFASQLVGTTSAAQTLTLSNTGTATLTITGVTLSGTNAADFALASNTCGASLAAGSSCTIGVTFTPASTGSRSATVTVTDNSNGQSGSTQTSALSGTGVAPVAGLAPASLTFASQLVGTKSSAQGLTLSNTGTATLTITSVALSGTNAADFAETNTCGTSLAAGANCSVSVTFTPSATGSRSATVTVTDNSNGVNGSTQTASLTGTGTAPVAGLAPASLTFASQPVGTTSAAQTLTLSNTGTATLTITSVALSGTNAADFGETNTCGTSLAAGANCAVSVTFTPTASGSRSATVTVTDNSNGASGSTQTASLTGTGTAPAVTLAPASLSFGDQSVGTTSAAQSVTVTNSGNATLTLTSVTVSGDFTLTNGCGSSLDAGKDCTLMVAFKPTAAGTRTGTVTLTDNASPATQTLALTGTGVAPAVTLAPTSLTFASQNLGTTSAMQTVTVTNSGSATLTLTSITVSGDFTLANLCGSSLDAGKNCMLMVAFKPTASGTRTGTVTLTDNASPGTQTVALTGTGQGAIAKLSANTLSFSTALLVGASSAAGTLTLQNTGNAALSVTSIAASGDFTATNTCGSSLAANASCTISVTFTPTAGGSRTGTLTLTDNASGSPQLVSLSGTGQDFTLSATTTTASVAAGGTATYNLSLGGVGGLAQTVSFTCSGAPSLSTCTVSPASATPSGSGPAAITVTVTTTAVTQGTRPWRPAPPLGGGRGEWLLVGILGLAGLALLARRRPEVLSVHWRLSLATAGMLAALALGSAACGGGGNPVIAGTPTGNYTLTVTGSTTSGSTTVSHKTSLMLTVN